MIPTGMPLETGTRLGPYEIRTLLGVGGMGEVYRGRDTRLGRDVALKVISPRVIGSQSARERFEREARAASALNHPSIVTVYDVGETNGVSWIAMEWVDGRTLRQVCAGGPLPIDQVLSIARQIADGLAAAHAKGIVHRDLKPENVIIAADGRVRVLDFGLARQTATEVPSAIGDAETMLEYGATVEGVILGTPGYMSPEQAAGGSADFRADQFAFGALLYEMAAGRRAFERSTTVETLAATIREEPVPLASIRRGIPGNLDAVVTRCLAKKPEERFASTRDLVAALDSTAPGTVRAPAANWLRFPALAAGLVVVLVVAALSWTLMTGSSGTIDSLAVLPFENRSTDPDTNYLGDELTESLINQMSRVPSLTVMARATVFRFKPGSDPQAAGRQLGVGAVLTGSVNRRGDALTIVAELIDTASGARLWGDTYSRPFAELLRVQDEIASAIAEKLRLRLSTPEKRALGGQGTDDPEAYELFLKARHELLSASEEGDREARRLFLAALDKDPNFVEARLGVVTTYAREAGDGYSPPREAWAKADEHLEKVRSLDPDNFSARVSMAARRFLGEWDWKAAERDFKALAADPRIYLSTRYHPAAVFFWARGWPDQAVALVENALKVDPGNLESRIMLGDLLAHAGRLDDAAAYYRAIIEIAPSDARPFFGLAEVLKRKRDLPAALANLRTAYELSGEEEGVRVLEGAKTEADYDTALRTIAAVRLSSLQELRKDRYISPLDFARLYSQTGARDKAFQYLELAIEERAPMLVVLKVDPAWDPIRDDPRFADIVRRVGIP